MRREVEVYRAFSFRRSIRFSCCIRNEAPASRSDLAVVSIYVYNRYVQARSVKYPMAQLAREAALRHDVRGQFASLS